MNKLLAIFLLGVVYFYGFENNLIQAETNDSLGRTDLVEQINQERKIQELKDLADKGVLEAQYNLARMYYLGKDIPYDIIEYNKWLHISATLGFEKSREEMMRSSTSITPEQLEGQRLSREWLEDFDKSKLNK